jgi:alkylation response protein AidB-like acyl-CoA dehydrogenase
LRVEIKEQSMEFEFSDEQNTIRELAAQILTAEATSERAKAFEASGDGYDRLVWSKLAEGGLLGIAVPTEYDGMGYGFSELCVLFEEVGRRVAPVPVLESLALAGLTIAAHGTDAQKEKWLRGVVGGDSILTAALIDAVSGDLALPATTATAAGNGWVLDGAKRFVAVAEDADVILLPASADGVLKWFLVESGAAGLSVEANMRASGMAGYEVVLDGVKVASDGVLGGGDADGAAIAAWLDERALVATAALQVGVSAGALQMTSDYVREREQFGVPIGSFQAVQHRCADCFIDVEAMRWTMWRAAWMISDGRPALDEARIAKFWAADGGSRVATAAQHLHGGIGSDVDYPIHRYFLWAKSLELGFGSAVEQLVRIGRDMAVTGPAA